MNNIYIIGQTNTGKTTLAKRLSEKTGRKVISSSSFLDDVDCEGLSKEARAQKLSEESLRRLRINPDIAAKHIRSQITGPSIIEGIRNPNDYVRLVEASDFVFFLQKANSSPATYFEVFGLAAILQIAKFNHEMGLMSNFHVMEFDAFIGPCSSSKTFMNDIELDILVKTGYVK